MFVAVAAVQTSVSVAVAAVQSQRVCSRSGCSDQRVCSRNCYVGVLVFRISFGCCGRYSPADVLAVILSFCIVCVWVMTGHWLLMDGNL